MEPYLNKEQMEAQQKAQILIEALPYIQKFNRKIIVVKYGGSAMSDEELQLLLRYYLEGRSRKELARELGIDIEACGKRIQRAKAHLKAAMERNGLR